MAGSGAGRKLEAGQCEAEDTSFALGGEDPGGKAREARFDVERRREIVPAKLQRAAAAAAFELLGVPAGAARHRFPGDAIERIARVIIAQPRELRVDGPGAAPHVEAFRTAR